MIRALLFDVPRGSILRPLLYILYTAELNQMATRHDMHQVYVSIAVSDTAIAIDGFTACTRDINTWM